jgi:penicillin-binding protein 2
LKKWLNSSDATPARELVCLEWRPAIRAVGPTRGAVIQALCISLWILVSGTAFSQAPLIDNTGNVENPQPTWETQKQARTFTLGIPAPRGQITDRNGKPLAQSRLSYNLAISFPTPLNWDDARVLGFAREQIQTASRMLQREIPVSDESIVNHYKNRGLLPMDIVEDLKPQELGIVQRGVTPNLILRQTYVRIYPNDSLAAHILGYTGREAPLSVRPIENRDLIFSESEGKEGIEQSFDSELRGQQGVLHMTFDPDGNKMSERIARPPVPGYNVILSLDQDLQKLAEETLAANCDRGAMVILDPNTGEILAMASHPSFNPNEFVPVVPKAVFEAYSNAEGAPLYPRAFRSAYPPGSTFKTFVGLAALETGLITPKTQLSCPTSITVGDHTFSNWKKVPAGSLTFVEAMEQSCNTWFYQAGLKIGAPPIIEYTHRLGLGRRTGIPLRAETSGNIPTDEYMLRVHRREIKKGDVANMSIGQGDILISPLQMAQAMGVLATGGRFHQTRLVKQVQTIDNKVIAAYPDRIRDEIPMTEEINATLRKALVEVTEGGQGTGHRAAVKGIQVAGKTGTAQWGPTSKQRTAAWFAGYLPADNPQYAFAAVYEAPAGVKAGGGSHAAPMIGKVFRKVYGDKSKAAEEPAPEAAPSEEDNSG